MARPEILFPLFTGLEGLPGIGPKTARLFEKLGVTRPVDLIFLAPTGVIDRRLRKSLVAVDPGQMVTVAATVVEHLPGRTRSQPYRIVVEGGGVTFEVIHFRASTDWMTQTYPVGQVRVLSGRVDLYDGRLRMAHPDWALTEAQAAAMPEFEPVYPLTQGLTSRMVARAVVAAVERLPALPEWTARDLMEAQGWPDWRDAVRSLHQPDAPVTLHGSAARTRLAADEMLSHQLALQLVRTRMRRGRGRVTAGDGRLRVRAEQAYGFVPTGAQARSLAEIAGDMAAGTRMMRLLQGDVGAGKTWVALMAMLIAVEAGGQGVLMAPTEILARQHAAGLAAIAEACGMTLVLLTGRDRGAARAAKLAEIAQGTAAIVIGTHALMSADVVYADLRLVVIDEQHRFGVRQRLELTEKAPAGADVLVMTATPIPRTLALAGYGDLDLSLLDSKPPGRMPIETRLVPMERYGEVVGRLEAAVAGGNRAYWVCPLVEENADLPMISAEERHRDLVARLGPERVALVHGQMPSEAKDAAMTAFQEGRAQVLVATTVIEVGVDVPEATIMVVEQAEQFGLSQLHQLRGRVGRGAGRSFCLLMYRGPLGETAQARLQVMRETEDGFRIAEEDLRLRGAGDLLGLAQSGLPKFRVADLDRDLALMERARDDARLVLHTDPDLNTPRGQALRVLLYLMERDASVRVMKGG